MDEAKELNWHRSSDCEASACIEVAAAEGWIYLRNNKQPEGVRLRLSADVWTRFRHGIKRGDFDMM
jgi:hypothetical protein